MNLILITITKSLYISYKYVIHSSTSLEATILYINIILILFSRRPRYLYSITLILSLSIYCTSTSNNYNKFVRCTPETFLLKRTEISCYLVSVSTTETLNASVFNLDNLFSSSSNDKMFLYRFL